jgi:hypothetical protein
MDGQSENLREPRSEPVVAGLAPQDELETDEVPDSLVSEFSSLTTPYCWVITEDDQPPRRDNLHTTPQATGMEIKPRLFGGMN